MSIIKLLPENLINQIAAGEVVERPASVVKELVENSIDAGAKNIVIEIEDGGKKLIKITDDGKGMSEEDLEVAIVRHATSKISKEEDLWKILSLGFRGEALASICSVSNFSVRSNGYEINCDGGAVMNKQEVGMPGGTQVEVRDLFFNTPARQKYLKKESTEFGQISSLINSIALGNLDIAFKLVHNGKVVTNLPRVTDFISRISDIFGKATAEAMIPIFYGGKDLKLSGFIGKPLLSRASTKHQYFFVNGRVVRHHLFANIIQQAYKTLLMEHKKPVFFINIDIDPRKIDVNVHPRKVEIRFENQQDIMKIIYGCVKTALSKGDLIPKGFSEARRYMSDSFPRAKESLGSTVKLENVPFDSFVPSSRPASMQDTIDFSRVADAETDVRSFEEKMKAIVQLANSYIVAKAEDGLILIDQHAAHERVRYEELMNQFENQKKEVQPLLLPHSIELTEEEASVISENMEIYESLGFEIEAFGGKTFVVNAVPKFFAKEDIDDVVKGVLDDVMNNKNPSRFQGRTEEIITYMSCRSAIKFGQSLSLDEMQALINQMDGAERPYTCPHGRPTMVSLNMAELEKMFGRK